MKKRIFSSGMPFSAQKAFSSSMVWGIRVPPLFSGMYFSILPQSRVMLKSRALGRKPALTRVR